MKLDLQPLIRFMEHQPKNGDIELAILKCHLLIEELLTKILNDKATDPSFIEKANLSFYQKVSLVRSTGALSVWTWLWDVIGKLNKIRNELAHNLTVIDITTKCEDFIKIVEQKQGTIKEEMYSQKFGRFQLSAVYVFSFLSTYANYRSAFATNSYPH